MAFSRAALRQLNLAARHNVKMVSYSSVVMTVLTFVDIL